LEENLLKITVEKKKVSVDHLIWALFHAKDWKELHAVCAGRSTTLKTCGKLNCIMPDHLVRNRKRASEQKLEKLPVMTSTYDSISLKELLKILENEFPGEKIHFFARTVSF
jgi:hypothetical protein